MITATERKWIEDQLRVNGLKGEAAKKFTSECISVFERKHKQPSKPDFAVINWSDVIPGLPERTNTKR